MVVKMTESRKNRSKCLLVLICILFGLFIVILPSCGQIDDKNASSDDLPSIVDNSLSGQIVSEMETSLSSSSASTLSIGETSQSENQNSQNPEILYSTSDVTLTSSQIESITNTAFFAVKNYGYADSTDLIAIIPLIVQGAESKLSDLGISSESDKTTIINTIVKSVILSMSGRDQYLNDSSAESGLTAKETLLNNITETAISYLDEAGISSDITGCLGSIVANIVGSLDDAGLVSTELEGVISTISAGAVGSLDNISGVSIDNLSDMVSQVAFSATGALGNISMTDYDSDDLSGMVNKITAGATGALGNISMSGYDSDDLSTMVSKITEGATGAIGNISMTGYDSDDLSGMVSQITAGATGALDDISMDGYDSDDLGDMVEKITAGATLGLDDLSMDGYDSDDVSGMVTQITAGATSGLGSITMDGFDSDDISGLQTRIKSGAMDNLENLNIDGFVADSVQTEIDSAVDTAIQENNTDPKAITAFSFTAGANAALSADLATTISGTSITATTPFGTSVTALVATFTTNGVSVTIGGTAQVSGTTANNFTSAVTYTVTAADGSTQDYMVTLTVAANEAKAITTFSFTDATNTALSADVTATISGTNITATVPSGTDVTALIATFTTTGESVSISSIVQVSGTTANDFSSVVTYTVTAADSTTQEFSVAVSITPQYGFTVSSISGNITESGGTATFNVRLLSQPTHDVTIDVSSNDTSEGTVLPSNLTFTSINWNTYQQVTVSGVDDSLIDGNKSLLIQLAIANSTDSNFNGLNPDDVTVINVNDDYESIPDTGQTTSYTATVGEDHDYLINAPSYTDNGNDTINDNITGLVWEKKTVTNKDTIYVWAGEAYCNDLTIGGITDWRLPTIRELVRIANFGAYNPAINSAFTNAASSHYWSSTVKLVNTVDRWLVNFLDGGSGFTSLVNSKHVRCVYGDTENITSRFVDNGDSTITDVISGLIWQKDSSDNGSWEEAISYCENLTLGSQSNWRIPNVKELESIVDYTKKSPSIDATFFLNTPSTTLTWASTTHANGTVEAWGVLFSFGTCQISNKSSNHRIRCVRSN
jgi:hypothetical protein